MHSFFRNLFRGRVTVVISKHAGCIQAQLEGGNYTVADAEAMEIALFKLVGDLSKPRQIVIKIAEDAKTREWAQNPTSSSHQHSR